MVSDELGVSLDQASLVTSLVETGLEMEEALLTIWGSDLVFFTKPEVRVSEALPVDWHWK